MSLAATSSVSAQQAVNGADETPINNDITKPIHRLDFFLESTQSAGGTNWTPKVRYERPFDLDDGWKFAARVEFTAVSTNDGSNPPGTFATQWTKGFLTGIEVGVPLLETTSPLYKFKIEGHLAFRF
jgi:hypothetical protein